MFWSTLITALIIIAIVVLIYRSFQYKLVVSKAYVADWDSRAFVIFGERPVGLESIPDFIKKRSIRMSVAIKNNKGESGYLYINGSKPIHIHPIYVNQGSMKSLTGHEPSDIMKMIKDVEANL